MAAAGLDSTALHGKGWECLSLRSIPSLLLLQKVPRVQQVSEGELSEFSATHTGRQKPA